jgi:hypothetical protein
MGGSDRLAVRAPLADPVRDNDELRRGPSARGSFVFVNGVVPRDFMHTTIHMLNTFTERVRP